VRRILSLGVALLGLVVGTSLPALAQTTYHLHRESSTTSGLFQVRTVGPDASSLTFNPLSCVTNLLAAIS
jgi:hypothetical protein